MKVWYLDDGVYTVIGWKMGRVKASF